MEELIESYLRDQKRLKRYESKEFVFRNGLTVIWQAFESEAWYEYLVKNNIEESKEAFSNCAKITLEKVLFNQNVFGNNRDVPIYAILSDNIEVINSFANVDYNVRISPKQIKSHKELVQLGKTNVYIDSIIKSMNKDFDGLRENLKIMDSTFLKLKKNELIKIDYDFFNGIINKNKDVIFESINTLATKHHKKRNLKSSLYRNLVSQPAMGYAKIAWVNGYELEFDSPLIHNELLPCKPNKNYTDKVLKLKGAMTLEPIESNYHGIKLNEELMNKMYPKEIINPNKDNDSFWQKVKRKYNL